MSKSATLSKKISAVAAYNQVRDELERITPEQTRVVSPAVQESDCVRQGDTHIVFVSRKGLEASLGYSLKVGDKFKQGDVQLVDGSTQGSQHRMVGAKAILAPTDASAVARYLTSIAPANREVHPALVGSVILFGPDTRLEHPTHAHFEGFGALDKDLCGVAVFQRALADDIRRQAD